MVWIYPCMLRGCIKRGKGENAGASRRASRCPGAARNAEEMWWGVVGIVAKRKGGRLGHGITIRRRRLVLYRTHSKRGCFILVSILNSL